MLNWRYYSAPNRIAQRKSAVNNSISGSITHSLYLHIPFCVARCTYCAFNVYLRRERSIPGYIEALGAELRSLADHGQQTGNFPHIHTIYLGGGTPSLLE